MRVDRDRTINYQSIDCQLSTKRADTGAPPPLRFAPTNSKLKTQTSEQLSTINYLSSRRRFRSRNIRRANT
ncbi:MAG: hypothetical protein HC942_13420, partial [Microcoleus sp. SU_5_6]|nr:hypothetical protein [Microcoleus sp. SU_5_6]